jgi:hypothetical protein
MKIISNSLTHKLLINNMKTDHVTQNITFICVNIINMNNLSIHK